MYAGGAGECKDRLGQLHSETNKYLENDKSCALPVQQDNQSDTVTCLKSRLYVQNNVIISTLKVLEKQLTMLLEQCDEDTRVVQEHIALCNRGQFYCRKRFNCPYCPVSKFSCFFGTIPNADTSKKKANQELRLTDMHHTRKWSEFHRAKLEEAIVAIETEKKIQEANQEMENLQKTLEETEDLERKAEIESKLKSCETLGEIYKMTANNLCSSLETEYEWDRISNSVFKGQFTPEECRAMWRSYLHPKINKRPWTAKENTYLKELADKYGYEDWDGIAMELGTNRSGLQCIVHYFSDKQTFREGSWSKAENKVLKKTVKQLAVGSNIPWHLVANYLPGRSKKQVWEHWTYSLNPLIKKGLFTEEEDMLLMAGVRKHGAKFDKVAEMFQDRTSAQLRHRYTMVLQKPKLSVKWSPQDDALLLHLVKKYGVGQWKKISEHFLCFNRTQVRQHYKVLKQREDTTSEEEYVENERNLVATTSSLVYGISSNADRSKRRKLGETLLPIRKRALEPVVSLSADFNEDCFSVFRFMQSNPYHRETKAQYEHDKVERKFHCLLSVLYIFQARLVIPGYDKSLLSHHLLTNTDRQIISLLEDHHLVTEKERATNGLLDCKVEPVSEEEQPSEDCQDISVLSETASANSNLIKFTMPLNYTTLRGFQSISLYCELQKKKIAVDVMKPKGSPYSLFEQRLFSLFFWPILASKIRPDFTGSNSDAEKPKVPKKICPSRKKKRIYTFKKEKVVDVPPRMKRNYVKSGKYKRVQTEDSEKRRSSRIASTSAS